MHRPQPILPARSRRSLRKTAASTALPPQPAVAALDLSIAVHDLQRGGAEGVEPDGPNDNAERAERRDEDGGRERVRRKVGELAQSHCTNDRERGSAQTGRVNDGGEGLDWTAPTAWEESGGRTEDGAGPPDGVVQTRVRRRRSCRESPQDQRTHPTPRERVVAHAHARTHAHAHARTHAPCPSLVMSPFFLRTKLLPLNTVEHSARTTPMYRSSMAGRTARERARGRAGGQDGQGEGGQGKRGRAGGWVRRQNRPRARARMQCLLRTPMICGVPSSSPSGSRQLPPGRSRPGPVALSPSVKVSTVLYMGIQWHAQLDRVMRSCASVWLI